MQQPPHEKSSSSSGASTGHDASTGSWAYSWPAQVRLGMGGDDKSMEVFRNPGAGKDFPVDWYKYLSERSRYRARDGIGMDFGYAEDEIMVVHRPGRFNFRDVEGGFATFSFAWNESGTADSFVTDPKVPGATLMLGMGMHLWPEASFNSAAIETRQQAIIEYGPKITQIAEPSNMIAVTDSFVDLSQDAWVSVITRNTSQHPGAYFSGQGNFAFLDGHVESLKVRDYTLINDDPTAGIVGNDWDPNDTGWKSRMRRWNNDARPNTDYWQ